MGNAAKLRKGTIMTNKGAQRFVTSLGLILITYYVLVALTW